ncbi:MAG: filamentous hemagglutinin N-terminal domain-containing protein [Nitrosomonadales bacterium]|nr:filamentous hemagglutinin N-terminal domain-containing protein [Nitrosomonadales bacterium]
MKTTQKILWPCQLAQPCQSKHAFRLKILALTITACFSTLAMANPVGPVVVNGAATVVNNGNTTTVTNTPGAILNWQQFSIGQGQTTQFNQQSAQSSVLNRVTGSDASQILGTLRSNGQVFLINPNGIMFGAGSVIDVHRLIASTLNITNADFLANNLKFNGNNGTSVVNQGQITTPFGGSVYLIGNNVTNEGVITTPQGEVVLAAGNSVSMVNSFTPHVSVTVTAGGQALNLGQVTAQGGSINIYGALVQQQGIVSADSVGVDTQGNIVLSATQSVDLAQGSSTTANGATGGNITLLSGATGNTTVAGIVGATGGNGSGGNIQVLGNTVALTDTARLDASGTAGGGTILVGGDYQGKNAAVQNAFTTSIAQGATLKVDATLSGSGGKIIAWSDNTTHAYGSFSARGGAQSGNGGLIETSGHYLEVAGIRIDAAALNGAAGTWLLDPVNATIGTALNGATVTDATINTTLNAGTNVNIIATGNIIMAGAQILKSTAVAAPTLTLNAGGDINIDSASVIDSVDNGFGNGLNVSLIGGGGLFIEGGIYTSSGNLTISTTGGTTIYNGASIDTANGNVSITAQHFDLGSPAGLWGPIATLGSINAGTGTVGITATGVRDSTGIAIAEQPGTSITGSSVTRTGTNTAPAASVNLTNAAGVYSVTSSGSGGSTHTFTVSSSGWIACATVGETCSAKLAADGSARMVVTNSNGTKTRVWGSVDPATGITSGTWMNLNTAEDGTFTGQQSASTSLAFAAGTFSGTWKATSGGTGSGTWLMTISASGAITESDSGVTNGIPGGGTGTGILLANGSLSGTSAGGVSWYGSFDPATRVISGTWDDPYWGVSGTFTSQLTPSQETQICLINPSLCASSPPGPGNLVIDTTKTPGATGKITYGTTSGIGKEVGEARKEARKADDEAEKAEKHEKEAKTPKEKEAARQHADAKSSEADAKRADAKIREAEAELRAAEAEVKSAKSPQEKIRAETRKAIAEAKRAEGEVDKAVAETKLAEAEARGAKTPEAKVAAEKKKAAVETEAKKAEMKKAEADARKAETELKQAEAEAKTSGSPEAKAAVEAKKAEIEAKKVEAEIKKAEVEAKSAKDPAAKAAAETKLAAAEAKKADAEAKQADAEARLADAEAKSSNSPVAKQVAEAKKADAEAKKADAEAKKAEVDVKSAHDPEGKAKAEVKVTEAEARKADAEAKKAEAEVKVAEVKAKNSNKAEDKKDVEDKKAEAEVKKAEAEVKKTDADVKKAKGVDEKKSAEARHKEAEVKHAEAEVEKAEREAKRDNEEARSVQSGYTQRATSKKAEASAAKAELKKAELEAKQAQTPEARAAAEKRVASLKAEADRKETEFKDAKRSSDSRIIETFGGMSLASMAKERVQAAMFARHEFKVEILKPALNILKADPKAADLRPCGPGSGDVCIRPPSAAIANALIEVMPRIRVPVMTPVTSFLPAIQRKVAVVIGINAYQDPGIPSLNGAANDADGVGQMLKDKMGYDVLMVRNGSRADIVRALNKISDETGSRDSVMVYYAGHGYQTEDTKTGYWIPSDGSSKDPSKWISNADISRLLTNIPAKQMILVSDSCFSGTLASEQAPGTMGKNVQEILGKRSVVVMSSGGEEPVLDEGKDGHSVFSWHLMDKIGKVEQYKNGIDVFDAVKEGVAKDGIPQVPLYGASVSAGHMAGGEYLFEVRKY